MSSSLKRVDACDSGVVRTYDVKRNIVTTKTKRQLIEIDDVENFGVSLYIDSWPQCAQHDTDRYHEILVHPGLIMREGPFDVLILGGGDFGAASELVKYPNLKSVRIVDWDLEFIDIAKEHLFAIHKGKFSDPRVLVETATPDAFEFLKINKDSYDVVFGDLTDLTAIGDQMNEIMGNLKARLRKDGAFISQCAEFPGRPDQFPNFVSTVKMISASFKHHWLYKTYVPSFGYEQTYLVCSDSDRYNPVSLSRSAIADNIARLSGVMNEYSAEIHFSLFAISPAVIRALA